MFMLPEFSEDKNCTVSTDAVPFQSFQLDITMAGVYSFTALTEKDYKSGFHLYIYNSTAAAFNPATSCAGLRDLRLSNLYRVQGGPVVNEGRYLPIGTYTVVAAGSETGGIFAVNVYRSDSTAMSLTSPMMWSPPSNSISSTCDFDGTVMVPFVHHSFTAMMTADYDVYIYAENATVVDADGTTQFDMSAGLYMSSMAPPRNGTCDAPLVAFTQTNSLLLIIQKVRLMAGMNYTVIASGADVEQNAWFGFSVRLSNVFTNENGSVYAVPSKGDPDECTPGTTEVHYFAFTFTALYPTYILDTQTAFGESFDTWSFLYLGNAAPAGGCPVVYQGDTGDITPLAVEGLVMNQNYTIYVTPYSQGIDNVGPFALYFYTGMQLGGNYTTPGGNTNMPSGGVISEQNSNAINTNMPTGNMNTNMPTGNVVTQPSSAMALFAGLALLIAALF
jgi:hypothetical protein